MKNISMIAAHGLQYELGKNNDLIWKYKEDLQWFKKNTLSKVMVMGRKTFESLPGVLPYREHWVLTKDTTWQHSHPQVTIFHNLTDIISQADKEICVIGGGEIYRLFLPYADTLFLTHIKDTCSDADTFFPEYKDDFILESKEEHSLFDFTIWHKKMI